MLRFRYLLKKGRRLNTIAYSFSTTSYDPYYVLGVEKTASYDDIKKKYYKLAAEYHPDINKDPGAPKQFMLIKESFELIRKWQGKAPKIEFENTRGRDPNFRSVRPNASSYTDESTEDDANKDNMDYKEWEYKARESAEHAHFASSFRTIFDIKDIKFTPTDIDLPDPSKRFDISPKQRLKGIGETSKFFIGIVTGLIMVIFFWLNMKENKRMDKETENKIDNLMKKDEYTEFIADNHEHVFKQIEVSMSKQKEYINFSKKVDRENITSRAARNKVLPDFKPVLTKEIVEELNSSN